MSDPINNTELPDDDLDWLYDEDLFKLLEKGMVAGNLLIGIIAGTTVVLAATAAIGVVTVVKGAKYLKERFS